MKNKIYGILILVGVLTILSSIVWGIGYSFGIFSPITTWGPSIRIITASRGTTYGDSVYVCNLQKKADILSHHNYPKRERRTRKKLLDFYIDRHDTLSLPYAVSKLEYFRVTDTELSNYSNIRDAEAILWNSWQNNGLNDHEKELLLYAMESSTHDETLKDSEQVALNILSVAGSLSDSNRHKIDMRQMALYTLAAICMQDISRWSETQDYFDKIDPHLYTDEEFAEYYWLLKSRFELQRHNVILASQFLDSAKVIDCRRLDLIRYVTEVQQEIYDAMGQTRLADKERRKQIALLSAEDGIYRWQKNLLRFENAIHNHRKFLSFLYGVYLQHMFQQICEHVQERGNLTNLEKRDLKKMHFALLYLHIECFLEFAEPGDDAADILGLIDTIDDSVYLPSDIRVNLISSRIKTALLFPTDSSSLMIEKGMDELRCRLRSTFPHFTDGEKSAFWKAEEPVLRGIYASKYDEEKYNASLLSKGILLSSSNQTRRAIWESGDSSLIADWNTLQRIRQVQLVNMNLDSMDIQAMNALADSLDHSIARRSSSYQSSLNSWDIRWQNVQDALGESDCAIEYIAYPIGGKKNPDVQYAALVLSKSSSKPVCVTLCKQSELDIDAIVEPHLIYSLDSKILDKIWSPLTPFLTHGRIYVSMDGELHHLNIESLPVNDTLFLSEVYDIRRVSSTRNIVLKEKPDLSDAALFGGVDYNQSVASVKKETSSSTQVDRSFTWSKKRANRSPLDQLPNALVEVKAINTLLTEQGFSAELFTGTSATEDNLYGLSGKNKHILHISTHGFYMTPDTDSDIDPMRCWGLAFAGANSYILNEKVADNSNHDGIASAAEIATLNLSGNDLVVLSACQTARGSVSSEGVFGLQRAFKQAGAGTIVMSLWNVNDLSTSEFMTFFYQGITEGLTSRVAFNNARRSIRNKYPNNAEYWAAFIMLD